MLDAVRIPEAARRLTQYPHELSGGMRQRVMIAMALACRADVLIADEPTTALDVTVQAQILKLMRELKARVRHGLILITHDMGVVAEMADRVVVMRDGRMRRERRRSLTIFACAEAATTRASCSRPCRAWAPSQGPMGRRGCTPLARPAQCGCAAGRCGPTTWTSPSPARRRLARPGAAGTAVEGRLLRRSSIGQTLGAGRRDAARGKSTTGKAVLRPGAVQRRVSRRRSGDRDAARARDASRSAVTRR